MKVVSRSSFKEKMTSHLKSPPFLHTVSIAVPIASRELCHEVDLTCTEVTYT